MLNEVNMYLSKTLSVGKFHAFELYKINFINGAKQTYVIKCY